MTEHYCIITFESTHTAIATEQALLEAGLKVKLIPVPVQITAGCGLSLRFDMELYDTIRRLVPELPLFSYYEVTREGRKKTVVPVIRP